MNRIGRICSFLLITAGVALLCLSSMVILASDSIQWKRIGPGGGGNMSAAAVSPADANIAIMGSDVGGIFRTGDGGQTWSIRNNGLVDPKRFSSYGINENFGFDPV